MKLNVGCGPHYANGWVNTDLVRTDTITPDVVVTADNPFPFPAATFERAYVGHVLEHIPWGDVPDWLDRLARVLVDDAVALFVGPDVIRVLNRWRDHAETWDKVAGIIESTDAYHDGELRWDADRHHWNCHEGRVAAALTACGWRNVTPLGVIEPLDDWFRDPGTLDGHAIRVAGWPLVSDATCQFAVAAKVPAR